MSKEIERCDRADLLVQRGLNCGWITKEHADTWRANIRIGLDMEVEAGGPYPVGTLRTPVLQGMLAPYASSGDDETIAVPLGVLRKIVMPPPDTLDVLRAQHKAIDCLLAMLIEKDRTFFPTKSALWPLILQGANALAKAEASS